MQQNSDSVIATIRYRSTRQVNIWLLNMMIVWMLCSIFGINTAAQSVENHIESCKLCIVFTGVEKSADSACRKPFFLHFTHTHVCYSANPCVSLFASKLVYIRIYLHEAHHTDRVAGERPICLFSVIIADLANMIIFCSILLLSFKFQFRLHITWNGSIVYTRYTFWDRFRGIS